MYYQYIAKNEPEAYLQNKEILSYVLLSDEEYQSSIIWQFLTFALVDNYDYLLPFMAFHCGQNIHVTKYEMENKHSSKRSNESNCKNTKSRILKSLSK